MEALKSELEDSLDATAAMQEVRHKRETEVQDLKKNMDVEKKQHEEQIQEMRQKYNQQLEAVNEELDAVRKVCTPQILCYVSMACNIENVKEKCSCLKKRA